MASVNGQNFQKLIAQLVFQGDLAAAPDSFYLGLAAGVLPLKDATFESIVATEVTGAGYARALLTRDAASWPSIFLSNGNWKIVADTRRFAAAGGDWTAADFAFLCDVPSGSDGRWFVAGTLDQPFLNLDGDTWDGSAEWIGSP